MGSSQSLWCTYDGSFEMMIVNIYMLKLLRVEDTLEFEIYVWYVKVRLDVLDFVS